MSESSIVALKQALPYVRLYKGKTFVVKVGGRILSKRETLDALLEDVCLLQQIGIRIIFVHGGGPQASEMSRRLGLEPKFVAGRRVTDAQTLEVAKMVYAGSLSVDILSAFRLHQTAAVGLSGVDCRLITAKRRHKKLIEPFPGAEKIEVDFGYVGDIEKVDPSILEQLLSGGVVPVISPLACDSDGNVFNVNADSIAEAVARAMRAEKLLILTDTDGLLKDVNDPRSLVSCIDIEGVEKMRQDGQLSGGMRPKVEACVAALKGGVRRAHILNGARPGALLEEIFTNAGCGTLLVEKQDAPADGAVAVQVQ